MSCDNRSPLCRKWRENKDKNPFTGKEYDFGKSKEDWAFQCQEDPKEDELVDLDDFLAEVTSDIVTGYLGTDVKSIKKNNLIRTVENALKKKIPFTRKEAVFLLRSDLKDKQILIEAAELGLNNVVRYLLSEGYTKYLNQAFSGALAYGYCDTANLFMTEAGVNPRDIRLSLLNAIQGQNITLIKMLLDKGVPITDNDMFEACYFSKVDEDIINLLVRSGGSKDVVIEFIVSDTSLTSQQRINRIKEIIKKRGFTDLTRSISAAEESGRHEIVTFLKTLSDIFEVPSEQE